MLESLRHLVGAVAVLMKEDGLALLGYQLESPEPDKRFRNQAKRETKRGLRQGA